MKSHYILLLLFQVICWFSIEAQTRDWLWFQDAGGEQYDQAYAIATSPAGDTYVTGYYESPAVFGSIDVPCNGYHDSYIAKINSEGVWQWVRNLSSILYDDGVDIVVDDEGSVYAMGYVSRPVTCGPFSIDCSPGFIAHYIVKLNTNGDWVWVRSYLTPTETSSVGFSQLLLANDGSMYISGGFTNTVSFGTHQITSAGNSDVFIGKIDIDGNWLWVESMGGSESDVCFDMASDSLDNVYLCGLFVGAGHFGSYDLTSSGYNDIFITKFNDAGVCEWAVQAGSPDEFDWIRGITVDNENNVYFSGGYYGTGTFGTNVFTSQGNMDFVIGKLTSNGEWLWAQSYGSVGSDASWGIISDQQGSIYGTGEFCANITLGSTQLTCMADRDIFVYKIDSSGNIEWAGSASPIGGAAPRGLSIDLSSNIYIAGGYYMDFTLGQIFAPDPGQMNLYVAKYGIEASSQEDVCQENASSIVTYPNPFSKQLNIKFQTKTAHVQYAGIYNIRGQLVYSQEVDHGDGEVVLTWDGHDSKGSRCASGVYTLKMTLSDHTSVLKHFTLLESE